MYSQLIILENKLLQIDFFVIMASLLIFNLHHFKYMNSILRSEFNYLVSLLSSKYLVSLLMETLKIVLFKYLDKLYRIFSFKNLPESRKLCSMTF